MDRYDVFVCEKNALDELFRKDGKIMIYANLTSSDAGEITKISLNQGFEVAIRKAKAIGG